MFAQESLGTNWLWDYGTERLWDSKVGKALRNRLERTYFLSVKWVLRFREGKSFTYDRRDLTWSPPEVSRAWTRKREKAMAGGIERVCERDGFRWSRRQRLSA